MKTAKILLKLFAPIVAIVSLFAVYYFRTAYYSVSGCSQKLLSNFESNVVMKRYVQDYGDNLVADGYDPGGFYWDIRKQGRGCVVDIHMFAKKPPENEMIHFVGDGFVINLEELTIFPQSEGASLFLESYGGSVKLSDE